MELCYDAVTELQQNFSLFKCMEFGLNYCVFLNVIFIESRQ